MNFHPTTLYIISGILVAIVTILSYLVRNLLVKIEKYEDITEDQEEQVYNELDVVDALLISKTKALADASKKEYLIAKKERVESEKALQTANKLVSNSDK